MSGSTRTPRSRRTVLVAVLSATVAGASLSAAGAASAAPPATSADAAVTTAGYKTGNYVVVLRDRPAATYTGGVSGLAATKPVPGRRLDAASSPVQRYRSYLNRRQDSVLRQAGVTARARYTVALNGFAGRLTGAQAAHLAKDPAVLSVVPDRIVTTTTANTNALLGLSGRKGLWSKLGGQAKAGKGVVVGVIDTGYRPESASFAGPPVTTLAPQGVGVPYLTLTGRIAVRKSDGGTFYGVCQAGPEFKADLCNSKVVGARAFSAGITASGQKLAADEVLSPRDTDSHGSHTASTAAGNIVKRAVVAGRNFGSTSGMAPGAKISVYKALYRTAAGGASGTNSDIVASIDAAVSDGVDVINYSVGPAGGSNGVEVDDLAFLNAAAAGVFVSASAGNDGPTAGSVSHLAPWETTVAAATADLYYGTVVLGNGTKYRGASINGTAVPASPAVLGSAAAAAGATAANAGLCVADSLDPAKVTGKVVVCDRGVNARVAKSAEVARAGGVGMVLTNVSPLEVDTDIHAVPTVHVDNVAGAKIKAYVSGTASPTIAIAVGDTTRLKPEALPQVAGFSSRGPAESVGANLLKPDIAAPGVSVIAAVVPSAENRKSAYGPESGTSMSAPHIAGLAALILQVHPKWSPAAVKSAIMTTATDTVLPNGKANHDPFAQGAGFVNPRRFLNPGLVYDASVKDYYGFLEGIGIDTGSGAKPADGTNVNVPSIAVGALAGTRTVTRRVTALQAGTWRASVHLPKTVTTVSPRILTFARAGQTKTFTVRIRTGKARIDAFTTGFLTWKGSKGITVRSPIAVRPVAAAAPTEVHGTGATGSKKISVVLGRSPLAVTVKGLAQGTSVAGSVTAGAVASPPVANASNYVTTVTVPAGSTLLRAQTVNVPAGNDDDVYVYDSTGAQVAAGATSAANETADLLLPKAGTYTVLVNGFASAAGGAAIPFTLRTFVVGNTAAGNLTTTPTTLRGTVGGAQPLTITWKGLDATKPYLGWIGYGASATRTIVSVN